MGYFSCNGESSIAACDSYNFNLGPKTPKPHKTPQSLNQIIEFSYSDLHSSTNGFSQSHLLGKGSHGSVYRADISLPHHHRHRHRQLIAAVKKSKPTNPNSTLSINPVNTPTENEFEILSRVHHPRLVNILGHSIDSNHNKLIVVEFMPNGSLFDLLHGSSQPPGWTRRVRLAVQVAKAVHFLHSSNPPVIHRDVKSSNVLIDANSNARLSDFGLALRGHVEDVRVKCTPPAGTLGYLDPGYLAPGDLSTKSDVFSFGILLLEIISGRNAIDVNFSPPSVVDWALPAIKSADFASICDPRIGPPEDDAALMQLALLAAKCVRASAAKRPTMGEVVECLKHVYKRVNNPIWNNLGRRVDCVRDSSKYEPLDDEGGGDAIKAVKVGIRRNRKVSNVMSSSMEEWKRDLLTNGMSTDRIGRSRSIGSFREIEFGMLDLSSNSSNNVVGRRRGGGLAVKMPTVRLSKSRSMGMLQSSTSRLVNNDVKVKFLKTPNAKELEESKLLKKEIQKN
ncbi:OLC1v1017275C1 [Oldenlandia corymbosa var. corymbosa]|uniref:OLC1v1017275C1 n=1 Tax=Oldenlandia corymbosa var. corymbosa TaxID=529605 RepID=A0AAV1E914_OLDCO|nr:OLC1v1017275C1 [Oldenlandia corymbosa var. corymbosa]